MDREEHDLLASECAYVGGVGFLFVFVDSSPDSPRDLNSFAISLGYEIQELLVAAPWVCARLLA